MPRRRSAVAQFFSFAPAFMPKLASTPFDDEEQWLLAIGRLIWRMGQLEYLTFEWCLQLGGVSLRDKAITKIGFGERYKLVLSAIANAPWPDARKQEARKLWRNAKCFATFRNKVAHAPVLRVRGTSVMLDAHQLMGVGKRPVSVFRPEFISGVSEKIQALAQKLDWF